MTFDDRVPVWCSHNWYLCYQFFAYTGNKVCQICKSTWHDGWDEPKNIIGYVDGSILAKKEEPS